MKKIGIVTLGCRVNQYESDALTEALEKLGYKVVDIEQGCDLYIVNTCTVTAESDAKCRKTIRRLARLRDESGGALVVMGCFAQGDGENEVLSLADYVIGNRNKMSPAQKIDEILKKTEHGGVESLAGVEFEEMNISRCRHAKAYVKIEDGCNNFCTYCFVPYVRGRVRSRDTEKILDEIKRLEENGYVEIILTGIETASFGEDRGENDALCSLVERISRETGIKRLRFGSMYPSFFTEENSKRLAACPCVMPHFHLSVQSASDNVLGAMGRGYDSKELYEAVDTIRRWFPKASLSCDMICGFPGETEEDFLESAEFIKRAHILHAHIFPYSKRRGTRAEKLPCQLSETEKKSRALKMQEVAQKVNKEVTEGFIGDKVSVLVEKASNNMASGYTEHFVYVNFKPTHRAKVGDVAEINLTKEHIS